MAVPLGTTRAASVSHVSTGVTGVLFIFIIVGDLCLSNLPAEKLHGRCIVGEVRAIRTELIKLLK